MKSEAEMIEYKNKVQHKGTINKSLTEIKNIFCDPQNWIKLYSDLDFIFPKSTEKELYQNYVYQAKKKKGEEKYGTFKVVELIYNENKSFHLVIEQQTPGSFFSKMRHEHIFTVTENGIEYLQDLQYDSTLSLKEIIGDILKRAFRRLNRLLENPKSFEIEKTIRESIEFFKEDQTYKAYYDSSVNFQTIMNTLRTQDNYSQIYPRFKEIKNNEIVMTFKSITGPAEIRFSPEENEDGISLKSINSSGVLRKISFIHRLYKTSENKTRHELSIHYSLPYGTNNLANENIPLIEEGFTNMITTILRKTHQLLEEKKPKLGASIYTDPNQNKEEELIKQTEELTI